MEWRNYASFLVKQIKPPTGTGTTTGNTVTATMPHGPQADHITLPMFCLCYGVTSLLAYLSSSFATTMVKMPVPVPVPVAERQSDSESDGQVEEVASQVTVHDPLTLRTSDQWAADLSKETPEASTTRVVMSVIRQEVHSWYHSVLRRLAAAIGLTLLIFAVTLGVIHQQPAPRVMLHMFMALSVAAMLVEAAVAIVSLSVTVGDMATVYFMSLARMFVFYFALVNPSNDDQTVYLVGLALLAQSWFDAFMSYCIAKPLCWLSQFIVTRQTAPLP